jgi:hypothetical protein
MGENENHGPQRNRSKAEPLQRRFRTELSLPNPISLWYNQKNSRNPYHLVITEGKQFEISSYSTI